MPDISRIFKNAPSLEMDEAKKRALLVYLGIFFALVLFYFFIFLKPSIAKLLNLVPEARRLKAEIAQTKDDLEHKNRLMLKIKALEGSRAAYEKGFSREKEIPILLENLSRTAKNSHVKIIGIRPIDAPGLSARKRKADNKVYQEVPIAVTAQSGYHELGKFINALENDKRFMQISDIKIKGNASSPKRHDIEFIVYAYTLEEAG